MTARTVVHFTDTAGFGGAEQMMLITLGGLDRARWRPVLVHYPTEGGRALAAAMENQGIATREIPGATGRRGARDLPIFARTLREESCSILHAHLVGPLRGTKGLLAARLAGVRATVATQHLYRAISGTRERTRQRLVSTLVDRYIAVSHGTARQLAGSVPARRISVIHNAIETDRFRKPADEPVRIPGGARKTVLAVARLHERKGIHHLVEAARSVPDAIFLIAGDGPERGRLEESAARLGVCDRVRFLGTRDDIANLLRSCDVFVLPSLSEGLPVSVIEAMAAARPVVATDIEGTDEIVVDGETGCLVPPSDPAALGRAIAGLLDDPRKAARLGAAGQERVEALFSVGVMLSRLQALYDEVLATGARGPR